MNSRQLDMVLSYLNEGEKISKIEFLNEEKKGYPVDNGYMGWLPSENKYRLFPTEGEYNEYYDENEED